MWRKVHLIILVSAYQRGATTDLANLRAPNVYCTVQTQCVDKNGPKQGEKIGTCNQSYGPFPLPEFRNSMEPPLCNTVWQLLVTG